MVCRCGCGCRGSECWGCSSTRPSGWWWGCARRCGAPSAPAAARCAGGCVTARDNKVRDLEVSGLPVTLVWSRRRLVCEGCERRFTEGHPAFEGSVTARLARRLVADAQVMTLASAGTPAPGGLAHGQRLGGGPGPHLWASVAAPSGCRMLLVDETSIRKRHRPNQQLAPSPAPQRPRLHQLRQLRSPRTPRDIINPAETSSPSHKNAKGQLFQPGVLDAQLLELLGVRGLHPRHRCCATDSRSTR